MNLQSIKQRYGIIGRSEDLDRALGTAVRVAPTDLTVLISGESGVGKEVFSQIIHSQSPRKHNKFIAVNCGAIPAGTINSELFGHVKGAFTGALSDRKGYFETVNGGTILLDEIGEMPLDTQSFLLRILESGEYMRVGSSDVKHTDVRIIAATNLDLLDRINQGKFREDLYYRLNTVPIHVPSLKERKEDIHVLFRKFASDFSEKYRTDPIQLDDEAKRLIISYPWPGNIRELKNVVEQLSVLNEDNMITAQDLLKSIPNIQRSLLPMITGDKGQDHSGMYEREILYKLLFDMKGDLNDLKQVVFELIKTNDLSVTDINKVREIQNMNTYDHKPSTKSWESATPLEQAQQSSNTSAPIVIRSQDESTYNMEEIEENLSMASMEKDLIDKVLKKHKNRRKDAAEELGISERTLYRKIKLYEL
jgi:transcriptional regulator with PAS, ATPase and Fis domain